MLATEKYGAARGRSSQRVGFVGINVFTMYGDSYLRVDVHLAWEAYQASSCAALMIILRNRDLWDKSNVYSDGRLSVTMINRSLAAPALN